jgi:hypothetical protein
LKPWESIMIPLSHRIVMFGLHGPGDIILPFQWDTESCPYLCAPAARPPSRVPGCALRVERVDWLAKVPVIFTGSLVSCCQRRQSDSAEM